jgi:hypothetical protein
MPTHLDIFSAHKLAQDLMKISSTTSPSPFRFRRPSSEPPQPTLIHANPGSADSLPNNEHAFPSTAPTHDSQPLSSVSSLERQTVPTTERVSPPTSSTTDNQPLSSVSSLEHQTVPMLASRQPISPPESLNLPVLPTSHAPPAMNWRSTPPPSFHHSNGDDSSPSSHSSASQSIRIDPADPAGLATGNKVPIPCGTSMDMDTPPAPRSSSPPTALPSSPNQPASGAEKSTAPLRLLADASLTAAKVPDHSLDATSNSFPPYTSGARGETEGSLALGRDSERDGDISEIHGPGDVDKNTRVETGAGIGIGHESGVVVNLGSKDGECDGISADGPPGSSPSMFREEGVSDGVTQSNVRGGVGGGGMPEGSTAPSEETAAKRKRVRKGRAPTTSSMHIQDATSSQKLTHPAACGNRTSSRTRSKQDSPGTTSQSEGQSIILDFLQDTRKRKLSFTLRESGRPGKVRKVA